MAEAIAAEIQARKSRGGGGPSGGSAAAAALSDTEELRKQQAGIADHLSATEAGLSKLSAKVSETEIARASIMAKVAAAAPGEGRERLKLEAAAARRELARVATKESHSTFQAVVREQEAVIANLWKVLEWAGLSCTQVLDLAAENVARDGARALVDGPLMDPPASVNHGLSTIRLEQLLTGSAARQFNAKWSARQDSARQSLVTPDVGSRSPNSSGGGRRDSLNGGSTRPRRQSSPSSKLLEPQRGKREPAVAVAAELLTVRADPTEPTLVAMPGLHLSREAAEALLIEDYVPCMAYPPEELDDRASEWVEVTGRSLEVMESQEAGMSPLPQSRSIVSSMDSESTSGRNMAEVEPQLANGTGSAINSPGAATKAAQRGHSSSDGGSSAAGSSLWSLSNKGLSVLPKSKAADLTSNIAGNQAAQPVVSTKLQALRHRLSGSLAAALIPETGGSPTSSPKNADETNSLDSVLGKTASPTRSSISKLLSLSRVRRRMDAA